MSEFTEPSLLPSPVRRDLGMRALETVAARLSALDLTPLVMYDVDNVPGSLLPHLAEQFNVFGDAGWDLALTDEDRRTLIKGAIELHRIKGTRHSVQRALELIGVVALITEWWQREPKGLPHTFSVAVSLRAQPVNSPVIDAARVDDIRRAVSFWKPVRSHFTMSMALDLGAQISVRIVGLFSCVQMLTSAGQLQPFTIAGAEHIRIVSMVSPHQFFTSTGSLKAST